MIHHEEWSLTIGEALHRHLFNLCRRFHRQHNQQQEEGELVLVVVVVVVLHHHNHADVYHDHLYHDHGDA